MICPNCEARLRRTERTGSVCGRCKRPFALDPRVHGRGMHDLRIRRRVQQLTEGGQRKVLLEAETPRYRGAVARQRIRTAVPGMPGVAFLGFRTWPPDLSVGAGPRVKPRGRDET